MKLVFDARFIREDHHDGISRFSAELVSALAKQCELAVLVSNYKQLSALPAGIRYLLINDPSNIARELLLPLKLNRFGATHVFSPMQTMGSAGRKYKLVLTQHDLIYYRHPDPPRWLSPLVRLVWRLYHMSYWPGRLTLNRADAIVTVSETSKKLIESARLTIRPVFVVYNAPSSVITNSSRARWGTSKQLVYMGSFMDYKNVSILVEGMKNLTDFELVLLSKISQKDKQLLSALAEGIEERIIFKNGVTDEEYHDLLAQAFALVSASKDEGFGIPLVEAMKQGLPLVVSDIEIFKEVAGAAAKFFDPSSPADFVRQIKALENQNEWELLSHESFTRGQAFDWKQSASNLLEIFKKL